MIIVCRVYGVLVSEANLPPLPNYARNIMNDDMDGFGRNADFNKLT